MGRWLFLDFVKDFVVHTIVEIHLIRLDVYIHNYLCIMVIFFLVIKKITEKISVPGKRKNYHRRLQWTRNELIVWHLSF